MKLLLDYLTVDETAELTGYSPRTIRAKVRTGILPAIRRGRRILIDRNDLRVLYTPAKTSTRE